MTNVFLASSPVLFVLTGMLVLKKSAMKVAPIAMIYTSLLGLIAFNTNTDIIYSSFQKGILDGIRIVWLIFAAFSMLIMMQSSGAMDKIKESIATITMDKRIHVIIIALMFGIFLEGVAGAGTPAAIAAPFLIGLGFNPITAATAALMSNSIPVSWGGAGVTTVMGSEPVREYMSVMEASAMTGRIHMIGAFLLPFLIVLVIFGRKGFKGLFPFLLFSGTFMAGTLFIFSNFVSAEITSMSTGLISILGSLIFLKISPPHTPKEFLYNPEFSSKSSLHPLKAFSPYLILMVLLPIVRYSFSLSTLAKYGYTVWVGLVIFISALLGASILKVSYKEMGSYSKTAIKKVIPALIAMCGLLAVSNIMIGTGMMTLLASALSSIAGMFYPFIAVAIGSLGSFMTGTGLGSNIMFGPMHIEAAKALALNPVTIFASQNVGAALGNMICPNNVVAVATTVSILGKEGTLMRKVLPSFFTILIVYGLVALIYTHIVFV